MNSTVLRQGHCDSSSPITEAFQGLSLTSSVM